MTPRTEMPAYRHCLSRVPGTPAHPVPARRGHDWADEEDTNLFAGPMPVRTHFSSRCAGSHGAPRPNSASNDWGLIATQERSAIEATRRPRHVTRAGPRAQPASPPGRQGRRALLRVPGRSRSAPCHGRDPTTTRGHGQGRPG